MIREYQSAHQQLGRLRMGEEQTILPIIDISPFLQPDASDVSQQETAEDIHQACRDWGFFYVKNHGVPMKLQEDLFELTRAFFTLPVEKKMEIAMSKGGRACRGYFPVGNELTSGKPDGKEGLYLGTEILDDNHPKVRDNVPLHGRNQFPTIGKDGDEFRQVVLTYMATN